MLQKLQQHGERLGLELDGGASAKQTVSLRLHPDVAEPVVPCCTAHAIALRSLTTDSIADRRGASFYGASQHPHHFTTPQSILRSELFAVAEVP